MVVYYMRKAALIDSFAADMTADHNLLLCLALNRTTAGLSMSFLGLYFSSLQSCIQQDVLLAGLQVQKRKRNGTGGVWREPKTTMMPVDWITV